MQVFRTVEAAREFSTAGTVVTIGSFDGVHLAHQAIIRKLLAEASGSKLKSVLVTFEPHTQRVLAPEKAPKLLTTIDEKLRILEGLGVEGVLVMTFDRQLSEVKARDFLEQILLEALQCKCLVIGYNHAFGNRREGDLNFLKANVGRYGLKLDALDPVMYRDAAINSSRIRRELIGGEYSQVLEMLGHPFELEGRVVKGKGMGKSLGFPTINVAVSEEKIVPPPGVYAAYTIVNSIKRSGMMYIGESDQGFALEVNIFDFEGDLYGERVRVFPTKFMRPSLKFAGERDLIDRIAEDEKEIRNLFNTK